MARLPLPTPVFTVWTIGASLRTPPPTHKIQSTLILSIHVSVFPSVLANDITWPPVQEKQKKTSKDTHVGRVSTVLCWKMSRASERHPLCFGMASPQKPHCWSVPLCFCECVHESDWISLFELRLQGKKNESVQRPAALHCVCIFVSYTIWGFSIAAFVVAEGCGACICLLSEVLGYTAIRHHFLPRTRLRWQTQPPKTAAYITPPTPLRV